MLPPLGILVAGGRGRRLSSSGPKAHAVLGAETLLDRALACLATQCDEIVLAVSAGVAPPVPLPRGVFLALDRPGTRGPLAGLVAGMSARPFEVALVLAVDFPLARGAALATLAARLGDRMAVVPEPGGRAQPLFAAYSGAARAHESARARRAGAGAGGSGARSGAARGSRARVARWRSRELPQRKPAGRIGRSAPSPGRRLGRGGGVRRTRPAPRARVVRRARSASRAGAAPTRLGGVSLTAALPALRAVEPFARACWVYDLDAFESRARRFLAAFAELEPVVAYALKANALPALLERARSLRLLAEAGSIGELEIARASGYAPGAMVLNGNGRTGEEADWVARRGTALVNADHLGELDLLERSAAGADARLRVALRVNPGVRTRGHRYVATGGSDSKFGIAPREALEAWSARARWPHLALDAVHVHVGSQVVEIEPLEAALDVALELAAESARRAAQPGRWVRCGLRQRR
jgi:molybdopterin-guanine dinucleotide biosynthesis protein A